MPKIRVNDSSKRPRKKTKKTPISPLRSNSNLNSSYRWRDAKDGSFTELELTLLSNVIFSGEIRLKMTSKETFKSSCRILDDSDLDEDFISLSKRLKSSKSFVDVFMRLCESGVGEIFLEDKWFADYAKQHGIEIKVSESNDEDDG